MGYATEEQAAAIMKSLERDQKQRIADMPTEKAAIHELFLIWQRLEELGWRSPIYCPKDGTVFEVIEFGSTGIFDCVYEGEWPKGSWWAFDGGDMWPCRPALFRLKTDNTRPQGEE